MKYIILGVALTDRVDGGWARVYKRNASVNEPKHGDEAYNLGIPVEYNSNMERYIKTFDGKEYYHVTDRHGNIIRD